MIRLFFLLALLLSHVIVSAEDLIDRSLCLFDPVGRSGDIHASALDLQSEYLSLGVRFTIKTYTGESQVKRGFSEGICDAIVVTGILANEYNKFVSTLEMIGGFDHGQQVRSVFYALASSRFSSLYINNGIEMVGLFSGGFLYPFVDDERYTNLSLLEQERMFLVRGDVVNPAVIKHMKVVPSYGNSTNFASTFVQGKSQLLLAPLAVVEPLGISDYVKTKKAGYVDLPFRLLTLQAYIRRDRFPEDFGEKARLVALDYYESSQATVDKAADRTKSLALKLNRGDRVQWERRLEAIRNDLINQGVYDQRMIKIIRKIKSTSGELKNKVTNSH